MSESQASEISQLKAKYSEAARVAKHLGLPVRVDPSVYLVDVGSREGIVALRCRIVALYEQIAEKIVDIAEQQEPGKYQVNLYWDAENQVFCHQRVEGKNLWDLVHFGFNILSGVSDVTRKGD